MKTTRNPLLSQSAAGLAEFIRNGSIRYTAQRIVLGVASELAGCWFNWLNQPCVDGESIDANDFVKTVRSNNLCEALDLRIASDAFRWLQQQPASTRLNLLVTGPSLAPGTLLADFETLMHRYGLSSTQICFTVLAQDASADLSSTADFINVMRTRGCLIAMDSGEPGNPSLSLFGPLGMVDFLLINRCWVGPALLSRPHQKILRSLIAYGSELKLKIIAQGVNNSKLLDLARNLKVDYCEGLVGGHPLVINDLGARVDL